MPVEQLLMKIYIDCIIDKLLVHCYMYVLSHSVAQGSPFMPNENKNDLLQVVNSVFVRSDTIPELPCTYTLLEGITIWKRMYFNSDSAGVG